MRIEVDPFFRSGRLFGPLPKNLCQIEAHVTGLGSLQGDITALLVLGPYMGQPLCKAPGILSIIFHVPGNKSHFHIRIAILSGKLCHQVIYDLVCARLFFSTHNTDEGILLQINPKGHIMQRFITFLDKLGLVRQAVVNQLEFFLRYRDCNLKGAAAHSQTVIHKIFMGAVPSPQFFGQGAILSDHMFHGRIPFIENPDAPGIFFLHLFGTFHQVFAVGIKTPGFILPRFFLGVIHVGNSPESSQQSRKQRGN